MITLFFVSVFMILFAYAGYPLTMYLLAKYFPTKYFKGHWTDGSYIPTVTVIITCSNGEDHIYEKLANTFNTDYPNIDVIVTLDGSTDGTDSEITRFKVENRELAPNIVVIYNEKGGKEAAQNVAVEAASSEICIFTDLNTSVDPDAFGNLVRHFMDSRIGAVDGMSKVVSDGHSSEGAYLKYENKIREWESATCGLVTLGGCLFAARTVMLTQNTSVFLNPNYKGFAPNMQSDFRTALVAKTFGRKAVLDKDAVAYFTDGAESKEFERKHRTVVRGLNTFLHNLHLLNPFKYNLFSYALIGHKLMKWLVPFFMITALVSNWWLMWGSLFWTTMFFGQGLFYILAWSGYSGRRSDTLSKLASFFTVSNLAILKAWFSYAAGKRYVSWEATKR